MKFIGRKNLEVKDLMVLVKHKNTVELKINLWR